MHERYRAHFTASSQSCNIGKPISARCVKIGELSVFLGDVVVGRASGEGQGLAGVRCSEEESEALAVVRHVSIPSDLVLNVDNVSKLFMLIYRP